MKRRTAEILIALALAFRGSALLFSSVAMKTMDIHTLIGVRFLIAFAVLAIVFRKRLKGLTKKELLHSAIIGTLLYLCMIFELIGIRTVATSTAAFIENTAVIFVPLIMAIIRRKLPDRRAVLCAVIGMAGISLITLKGSGIHFTFGEFLILMGAITFALSIIAVSEMTGNDDSYRIGIMQLLFVGVLSMITAFIAGSPRIPSTMTEWGAVLYLSLVCTAFAFAVVPVAQQYTSPERTSLLGAFNPLAAMVLGFLVLDERFTFAGAIGAVLIFVSIFLPTLLDMRKNSRHTE